MPHPAAPPPPSPKQWSPSPAASLWGRIWAALLTLLPTPAPAQTLVTSPNPSAVQVTLYRDPTRGGPIAALEEDRDEPISPNDLDGFALVTETRTVSVPAGPAVIRFEGVAGNILPESAVLAGLPSGVRERNLDADLLSPRTLYDRSLGRRVLIRRTDKRTGRTVTEQAVIRSGADGAGVLSLRTGFEALRCSGLSERLVFPAVPPGLSSKPTLSIRTDSPRAFTATVTLSYLAGGFDWQADYTLTVRRDGRADLFAWVTLVSGDVTSFRDAEVAAVAGRPNRDPEAGEVDFDGRYRARELRIRCWPSQPNYGRDLPAPPAPPPPPPPPMAMAVPVASMEAEDIIVTGALRARQEELGDLKLYRLPARVTLTPQSQKQVAMLDRPALRVELLYRSDVSGGDADDPALIVRFRNRRADGLGLPLPQGSVAVFQTADARPVLLDTVRLADKAVDDPVELRLEPRPSVTAEVEEREGRPSNTVDRRRLTVANANPYPVRYEARIAVDDGERLVTRPPLPRRDGRAVWSVTVPANGRASLNYDVVDEDG